MNRFLKKLFGCYKTNSQNKAVANLKAIDELIDIMNRTPSPLQFDDLYVSARKKANKKDSVEITIRNDSEFVLQHIKLSSELLISYIAPSYEPLHRWGSFGATGDELKSPSELYPQILIETLQPEEEIVIERNLRMVKGEGLFEPKVITFSMLVLKNQPDPASNDYYHVNVRVESDC